MMADHPPALTLEELTREIKELYRRTWQDYVAMGARLKQVKAMLTHGAWLQWLETEVPFSLTTAERAMRADDLVQEYPALLDAGVQIDVGVVDLLTAKRTPTAVVRRVVRDAQKGTPISERRVQTELQKVRPPKFSTLENIPPQPAREADRALDQRATPPLPGGITFGDDADPGPSVEELMRQQQRLYDLGHHPPGRVWRLVRALRGFLDYEAETESVTGGNGTMWDAAEREALADDLLALRTVLEAQAFPFEPDGEAGEP